MDRIGLCQRCDLLDPGGQLGVLRRCLGGGGALTHGLIRLLWVDSGRSLPEGRECCHTHQRPRRTLLCLLVLGKSAANYFALLFFLHFFFFAAEADVFFFFFLHF